MFLRSDPPANIPHHSVIIRGRVLNIEIPTPTPLQATTNSRKRPLKSDVAVSTRRSDGAVFVDVDFSWEL
jgi:hypothetical protein